MWHFDSITSTCSTIILILTLIIISFQQNAIEHYDSESIKINSLMKMYTIKILMNIRIQSIVN